jgi:hypothetical protein
MPLAENLAAAQAVVDQITTFGFIAANRRSDRLRAAGGIEQVIATGDNSAAGQLVGEVRALNTAPNVRVNNAGAPVQNQLGDLQSVTLNQVRANCANILTAGAGNCWEQAQVAFLALHNNYPAIRPLDLMYFRNPTYDHVWVGVGLAAGWNTATPVQAGGQAIGYNLRNWGADAVWCDPWQSGGVVFSIADLIAGRVRNLDSIYKCETAERVAEGWPGSYLRVN